MVANDGQRVTSWGDSIRYPTTTALACRIAQLKLSRAEPSVDVVSCVCFTAVPKRAGRSRIVEAITATCRQERTRCRTRHDRPPRNANDGTSAGEELMKEALELAFLTPRKSVQGGTPQDDHGDSSYDPSDDQSDRAISHRPQHGRPTERGDEHQDGQAKGGYPGRANGDLDDGSSITSDDSSSGARGETVVALPPNPHFEGAPSDPADEASTSVCAGNQPRGGARCVNRCS